MGIVGLILFALVAVVPVCGARVLLIEQLAKTYNETLRNVGLESSTTVIEVWASSFPPYTWTILSTKVDGFSCIVTSGRYWQGPRGKRT